ncbi:phage tail sheath family protein [Brevibacillus dissolubilis]|uniref:phage tail sheath family protein n=1 Tax=Brevibacillus dissolubilis TaxID=1844116 RepID=UPI0011175896|nr:phage tail sheath family protein [Brevibacillus dissolubilis]
MAGGIWIEGVEQVRAGLYMNFKSKALERMKIADRGTVVLPLLLSWGEYKSFQRIDTEADFMDNLGYDVNAPEVLLVREAKKRAKTVLVYCLNNGVKASGTFGTSSNTVTVTAKLAGVRGNDLMITSAADVLDESKRVVKTLLKGRVVDEQRVADISELKANAWVSFAGTGSVPTTAGTVLSGGLNGLVNNEDHTSFLEACETQHFDVIAYPYEDEALKTTFVSFIKRMREQEGKKIQGVVANYAADYEGIINVVNGVKLGDGTVIDAAKATAWVAGATAGASIAASNTYSVYEGATDANPRMKNSDIIAALKQGQFLFIHDGVRVKVEKDINSLVTYSQDRNSRFSKNRVLRVLDAIANDFSRVVNESYVGKLNNNADGHALLKEAANQYLRQLQDAGAIQNVNFLTDFIIDTAKSTGDEVFATLGIQPVDSMEKFYFNVEVQ